MTTITLLGPNLSSKNQNKGNLHAHKAGCGDVTKGYSPYERDGAWDFDVESRLDVAVESYPPESFEWDPDDPGDWNAFVGDIWFAPCLKDLPDRAEPDLGSTEAADEPYLPKDV